MQKEKENQVSLSYILLSILILSGLVTSLCIFLYPEFCDAVNQLHSSDTISSYIDSVDSLESEKLASEKEKALLYNEELAQSQKEIPFCYQGSEATDQSYENLLSPEKKSEMCYIEIPSIQVFLPVSHGTNADILRYECGHLYGTSLPIGGISSHAVIAAHTGLRSARLFTDLDQIKTGDEFYIHILGEVHVYKVDQIQTVLPEEADASLQIIDGKDLITLYTCTPYGINDHRLLVRGVRQYPDLQENADQKDQTVVGKTNITAKRRIILMLLLPVLVLICGILRLCHNCVLQVNTQTFSIDDD